MKEFNFEERVKKLEGLSKDEYLKMVWMWSIQKVISLNQFKQLISALKDDETNELLPDVYPLIDNHRWYAENGTVYNEADEDVKIVLLHDNGSYTNLPEDIALTIASNLNNR